jgi:tetratricopeptide (TPR) repeat protein
MNETTDWGSALAILGAGLILGMMFVYFFARRRSAAPAPDTTLRDLEARRDTLVERLRSDVAADERTRLELETAQVLRLIDEQRRRGAELPVEANDDTTPDAVRRATTVGFMWGAGSMLALAGLAWLVTSALTPREPEGQQAMQPQGQQAQRPADPVVLQLEETIRRTPDDLEARISLAQAYLERENLMGVFEQTQYVLTKSPAHARALTYQALVRMSMGQQTEALQMLKAATKSDPQLLDAWVALAWVHTQDGKVSEAEEAMREAMRRRPDEKQRLEQVLAQMKSHQGMDMSTPQPRAGDGKAVRVTLDLDPAAKSRTGVIYVIGRAAGVAAGPPIAVKRVPAGTFPITFEFSSSDSMMGQPLPATMRIEARLDSDGDAMTRNAADPSAVQDGVAAGSEIRLALR